MKWFTTAVKSFHVNSGDFFWNKLSYSTHFERIWILSCSIIKRSFRLILFDPDPSLTLKYACWDFFYEHRPHRNGQWKFNITLEFEYSNFDCFYFGWARFLCLWGLIRTFFTWQFPYLIPESEFRSGFERVVEIIEKIVKRKSFCKKAKESWTLQCGKIDDESEWEWPTIP